MEKAVIAMSGGVDSSVAAALMKEQGYEVAGIMLKLYSNEEIGVCREKTCCSLSDAEDARGVADQLGMPFYMLNFSDAFEEAVIRQFVAAYRGGETPNPCIECNRRIKFEGLLQRVLAMGFDCLATGHYASVRRDPETGRWLLETGADPDKDQSYMLYTLTQEQLSRLRFPLGGLTKEAVRGMAEKYGLLNARKRESQDICFVQDGDYAGFIRRYTGTADVPGQFVGSGGEAYGPHKGITHYTMGQRKGLGLSFPRPMYVGGIDPVKGEVLLVTQEALYRDTLYAREVNLISVERLDRPLRVKAKIRYHHQPAPATAVMTEGRLKLVFDEPQRAVTRGQSVVMYQGRTVVGGGVIDQIGESEGL